MNDDPTLDDDLDPTIDHVPDPDDDLDPTVTASAPVGQVIDSIQNYRIMQPLGEGGMGIVYEAEQRSPVKRLVAVKLIKAGMDSKAVVARFESERQALAMMNHPNIARIYDAGMTDMGRPFFAMEFVKGVPIDDYCDRHRLSNDERLDLFIQVCDGVQHAHHKGIIHRDIKPSNVLITLQDDRPVPKIIDFGVAKATDQQLTETTLFTQSGQLVGTPDFMSPEQAEMNSLDVDTRTDVYSLGVLLYVLLVGKRPFRKGELFREGLESMRHLIREKDPDKPSTRFAGMDGDASEKAARERRSDAPGVKSELKGDLDWITMKAMEKDRTRRYGSPSEFAADIARHLNDEPVLASPPSTSYRTGKFVRRHRVGVAAGLIGLAAVLVSVAGITVGWVRAVAAEKVASREAETASQVSDFMIRMFRVSHPSEARGNQVTAREILDKGAAEIEQRLQDQPEVRARLMNTMGEVYRGLGLYSDSRPLIEQAMELRRELLGMDHIESAESMHSLGAVLFDLGDTETAQPLFQRALEIRERDLGPDHPDVALTLDRLAGLLDETGDSDAALPLYERALTIREQVLGDDHPDTASSLNNLAALHYGRGDNDAALELYQRALNIWENSDGTTHPDAAWPLNNVAVIIAERGDHATARAMHTRALEIRLAVLGSDHQDVATSLNNLAALDYLEGDLERARERYERALEIFANAFDADHPSLAWPLNNLAMIMVQDGEYARAEPLYEQALQIWESTLGESHPRLGWPLTGLGVLLTAIGEYDEAERAFRRALALREEALGQNHLLVAETLSGFSELQYLRGEDREAGRMEARAATIRKRAGSRAQGS